MVWKVTLVIALGYAALVGVVYFAQDSLIYFPNTGRAHIATPADHGLGHEEVALRTEDGQTLHAWWVPAAAARGTVLLFHGNAGNISHRIGYARMFSSLGYSTLLFDYRGYGRSTGTPSEAGTYRDALAARRWLVEDRSVRDADIVIFGESLGGAVGCWLAQRHPPRALVLASTFTSVSDLGAEVYPFLPVRLISRYKYDTHACLQKVRSPVLILHSARDDIIPYAHGRRLFESAREPKTFLEIDGGHNDGFVYTRPEWVRGLGAFLSRHSTDARGSPEPQPSSSNP